MAKFDGEIDFGGTISKLQASRFSRMAGRRYNQFRKADDRVNSPSHYTAWNSRSN